MTNADGVHLVLANGSSKESADIMAVQAGFKRVFVVQIMTTLSNGRRVVTSSWSSQRNLPKDPNVDAARFPWVTNAATLLEAHRRRIKAKQIDLSICRCPDEQSVKSWLLEQWDYDVQRNVRLGYRYLDAASDVYRFTWKGAILSVVRQQPAFRAIRRKRDEKESRQLWKSLEMDTFNGAISVEAPQPERDAPAPAMPAATETADELRYAVALPAGEIRTERAERSIIVRVGRRSGPRIKAQRWKDGGVIIIGITFLGFVWWKYVRIALIAPFLVGNQTSILLPLTLIYAIAIIPCAVRLARSFSATRGDSVLSANSSGLKVVNVPAVGDQFYPRANIEGLLLVKRPTLGGQTRGSLLLFVISGKRKVRLVADADLEALSAVRKDILEAMGMVAAFPAGAAAVDNSSG